MLSKEEIQKISGQAAGDRVATYSLDEVSMSGNDGTFTLHKLTGEKNEQGKYETVDLGKKLNIVILKMRWRLFKYTELADGSSQVIKSTEYDAKTKDTVTVYPSKEKGPVVTMKEKYGLSTQRILYVYVKATNSIARLIVKSSALSGDKNPNNELGLFEYIDLLNKDNMLLTELETECVGVFRPDPKGNKRKDYMAMAFDRGVSLTNEESADMVKRMLDVHERLNLPAPEEPTGRGYEYPTADISFDDIPFD